MKKKSNTPFLVSLSDKTNEQLDIILVTGDAYIDHPSFGVAIIGRYLEKHGYKVGIIGQPDITSDKDICYLGEPKYFWGVTAGSVDSIVANYTSLNKKRKSDYYTPGGISGKRPDRACIAYTNLIRKYFKNQTIVLGGIEASLRRLAHYDFQQDKIRRSILIDSKADYLIYGMAEKTIIKFADLIKKNDILKIKKLRNLCYKTSKPSKEFVIETFSYEEIIRDKKKFHSFFKTFYDNTNSFKSKTLIQRTGLTYIIQNPNAKPLTTEKLDEIYNLPFTREVHPYYKKQGHIKAINTIQFSITSHRGCYGKCNFCSLTIHQGDTVISRSKESILKEAKQITQLQNFKGTITDIGGPTANMYMIECNKKIKSGICKNKRCLFPTVCKNLNIDHYPHLNLLKKILNIKKVKNVFVSSGIRFDILLADKNFKQIFKTLMENYIPGQMKIAPEHLDDKILNLMGKPKKKLFIRFVESFNKLNQTNKYFVCYFIAGHPGSNNQTEKQTGKLLKKLLNYKPQQIQIFTPTPSTWSTTMYYTGLDISGNKIYVEKKLKQKKILKQKFLNF